MKASTTVVKARRLLQFERTRGLLAVVDGSTRASNGRVYVKCEKSTGNFAPPVPLPAQVSSPLPNRANIPVELGYDKTGQLVVLGVDLITLIQQGIDPNILNPSAGRFIQSKQLINLLCRRHPDQAFFVVVYPGTCIISGVVVKFEGGVIDLSADQPSAGQHCYVGVWLVDDGTLATSTSTAQSTGTDLDVTDLQQVYDNGPVDSRPLWAFVVTGDIDDVSDEGSEDMRDMR